MKTTKNWRVKFLPTSFGPNLFVMGITFALVLLHSSAAAYTVTSGGPSLFTDISSTGTAILENGDDMTTEVPIGFTFPFFGSGETSCFVSTNGLITFGSANSGYDNKDLSAASVGQPALAVMWDDFVTTATTTDKVFYQTSGSAGNRVLTVQWQVNAFLENNEMTFQCQLFEATGRIVYSYQDVNSLPFVHGLGQGATVGIQDSGGNDSGRFNQWSYNSPSLSDGLSIIFDPALLPEIEVQQPVGSNIIDGGSKSFGTVTVGTPATLDFVIYNRGAADLTGIAITIDGPDAARFSVTSPPATSVSGPSGSTTFSVQCTAINSLAVSATLHIASNDADESPFDISLTAGPKVLPQVTTVAATAITFEGATLIAAVNARGSERTVTFEYGETTSYGLEVSGTPTSVGGSTTSYVTAPISGLLGHTRYHFRAKASGPQGANTGADVSFVTANQSPSLIDLDFVCLPNAQTTLDPLAYSYDLDGDDISIASFTQPATGGTVKKSGATLVFTASPIFTTATFTYTIRDSLGATSTAMINLTSGSCSITPISAFRTSAGGSYTVQVSTDSLWDAYELLPWMSVSPSTGNGNGTVTVTLQPNASKNLREGVVRIGGVAHTVTQAGVLLPSISLPSVIPPAIVGGAYALTIPTANAPVTYTITNMPSGLAINHATGVISGIPTRALAYPMTVKATNAAGTSTETLAFTITVQPLPSGVVGVFHGLIDRHDNINLGLASRIELTTTIAGFVSGKIITGTTAKPFSGRLIATTADVNHPHFSILISGTDVSLNLTFDHGSDSLSGSLGVLAVTTPVNAWRNAWAGLPVTVAKSYTAFHTFGVEQTDADVTLPQGFGYGSVSVTGATCVATILGKLPDGSAITGSTFVGQAGQVLIYQSLYGNRGSCAGKLTLIPGVTAPADNTITGPLTWLKPGPLIGSKDTVYRAGFGPIPLSVVGGTYTAPTKGQRVMALPDIANNAQLEFTLGGLDREGKEFNQLVRVVNPSALGLTNTAVISPFNAVMSPNPNPNKVLMPLLTASSGLFGGEFTLAGTTAALNRKAPFSGQIVKTASGTQGYGFFLLPKVPGAGETVTTSPKLSGRVVFKAP